MSHMSQTTICLLHSGTPSVLDYLPVYCSAQKQLFIKAFLTKQASCKFTYCLHFSLLEFKTKTKIVLGVLKTVSLLAYYDMYKPETP